MPFIFASFQPVLGKQIEGLLCQRDPSEIFPYVCAATLHGNEVHWSPCAHPAARLWSCASKVHQPVASANLQARVKAHQKIRCGPGGISSCECKAINCCQDANMCYYGRQGRSNFMFELLFPRYVTVHCSHPPLQQTFFK